MARFRAAICQPPATGDGSPRVGTRFWDPLLAFLGALDGERGRCGPRSAPKTPRLRGATLNSGSPRSKIGAEPRLEENPNLRGHPQPCPRGDLVGVGSYFGADWRNFWGRVLLCGVFWSLLGPGCPRCPCGSGYGRGELGFASRPLPHPISDILGLFRSLSSP